MPIDLLASTLADAARFQERVNDAGKRQRDNGAGRGDGQVRKHADGTLRQPVGSMAQLYDLFRRAGKPPVGRQI